MASVATTVENSVLKITLQRSDKHNAFDREMIREITSAFQAASSRNDIIAVQLSAEGPSFCAGADLAYMKSMADYSEEENKKDALELFSMFESVALCRWPVVTIAHGSVMGGGLGLIAASDIVAAENATKFCFSEVKLGLVPAVISPFVLQKVSYSKATEWMLSAKLFSTDEALNGGLIHYAGSKDQVNAFIEETLHRLKGAGSQALTETKHLIRKVAGISFGDVKELTAKTIAARRVSTEGQEGLRAFLEKRKPNWKR